MTRTKVSTIICAYNRPYLLNNAIESLANQKTDDSFCVLVVDNNSEYNASNIIKKFFNKLNIKYIQEVNQGLSYSRNRGILESLSEYVAFLDDDAMADENWISEALEIINKDKPDIFGGPIYPFYEHKKPRWYKDEYDIRKMPVEACVFRSGQVLYGSNMFFKRSIFERIGYFNTSLGMTGGKIGLGEESQLQRKAQALGVQIRYYPQLIVRHLTPHYKTKISYILKRSYLFGLVSRDVLGHSQDKLFKSFYYFAKSSIFLLIQIIIFPLRNKNKFKYWQNYLVEKSLTPAENLGKAVSFLKK
jgi:glucosyl-dolichyl phosphate glucuronosyltransferase